MAKQETIKRLITNETPPKWVLDMVGLKFNKLKIIKAVGYLNKRCHYYVECICDCGKIDIKAAEPIKSGKIVSCDCYRRSVCSKRLKTHGESPYVVGKNKIFNLWISIKNRCFNKNAKAYPNYGGRGITMCNGLRHSFISFKDKVGLPPNEKLSLDRKNNNGNYSCGQCEHCIENGWDYNLRWANRITQANNTRKNVFGFVNGEKMTAAEAARKLSLYYCNSFIKRFKSGEYA